MSVATPSLLSETDINFDDLEIFIDVYFPSLNRILKSDIEISREIGRCLDRAFLLPSN